MVGGGGALVNSSTSESDQSLSDSVSETSSGIESSDVRFGDIVSDGMGCMIMPCPVGWGVLGDADMVCKADRAMPRSCNISLVVGEVSLVSSVMVRAAIADGRRGLPACRISM